MAPHPAREQADMADDDPRRERETTAGSTPMQPFESSSAGERSPLQEISTAMVQIYKDQFGRGPTKVRTNYAGPDTAVCLLEATLTPAERNLQAMGEHQRLRDIRLLCQYAEESRFTAPVERITGRKVRAFISGIDTNADIACEMFVLHPETTSVTGDALDEA
jgi:uncharacterized protein YbcI